MCICILLYCFFCKCIICFRKFLLFIIVFFLFCLLFKCRNSSWQVHGEALLSCWLHLAAETFYIYASIYFEGKLSSILYCQRIVKNLSNFFSFYFILNLFLLLIIPLVIFSGSIVGTNSAWRTFTDLHTYKYIHT